MKDTFEINISETELADLKQRLAHTRWPDEIENEDWKMGTNKGYLKLLCNYWTGEYDWKKNEAYLNSFNHFTSSVNGNKIHFIHEKGKGKNPVPLLLTHGFPDSFIRFLKIIPLLTEADENDFSFDVIIPSIPGYGFSGIPAKQGMHPQRIAEIFTNLMTEELGYDKFFAQGGDWGSSITEQIALTYPEKLYGIHLTDIPFHHLLSVPEGELTDAEKKYLETGKKWQTTEGGYAMIQSSKPQTVAYGLNDSPAGLAAWIIEKFHRWSDHRGNLENSFTKDELLNNLTIYWVTQTINSAMRIYYETMIWLAKKKDEKKMTVPTGAAIFPKDLIPAPREYADRFFNVVHWTEMPRGGHFAAMEQPKLFSDDIRKFATTVCSSII